MNYRCPACRIDLDRPKISHTIIARMEIDCPHCNSRIQLNVHRMEVVLVLVNFGIIVLLGATAYWLQSQPLTLWAIGAAMAGALALPLLERTCLRDWPRYTRVAKNRDS